MEQSTVIGAPDSHITLKTEAVRLLAAQSVSNWCHPQKQKIHLIKTSRMACRFYLDKCT